MLLQAVGARHHPRHRGTLAEQIESRVARGQERRAPGADAHATARSRAAPPEPPRADLVLDNGLGGFTPTAASTSSRRRASQITPAPWVNVLANPRFGTVVTESGVGLHLVRERARIPPDPWHNDPVGATERRGVLPARRGQRPLLVADAAALRRRDALP